MSDRPERPGSRGSIRLRPFIIPLLALAGCLAALGSVGAAVVYNSEEHKLIADRGASRVDPGAAGLPHPTRFVARTPAEVVAGYEAARELAVGRPPYSRTAKHVQDNAYALSYGFAQRAGNVNMHVPAPAEVSRNVLEVTAWVGSPATFTFGELVALYGDYRRTVHCDDGGRCYLTNGDDPQYRHKPPRRPAATIQFDYGHDCWAVVDCGYRPAPVATRTYLRAIASGLWPPYGVAGNATANTAYDEEELDAGWWGDEMLRIANVNDWHFSRAAIAWYVGMHRLALLAVEKARTDPAQWNRALHYEASALHSLTDLFAFGHVATSRDRTSYGIMYDRGLLQDRAYRWMDNVLTVGGGVRNRDRLQGTIELTTTLPPIVDVATARRDFMASDRGTWAVRAKKEHDYHDRFNNGGATVMNLKGQAFTIFGDAHLRKTSDSAQAVIAETVRASLQSLFDAYADPRPIEEIGRAGSDYFAALSNVPVFVVTHPDRMFDGQWTRFAAAVDGLTGAGIVPPDFAACEMPFLDGAVSLPDPRTEPCATWPARPETP